MKRLKKLFAMTSILGIVLLYIFLSGGTAEAASGKWMHNAKGWWYSYSDGSYAKDWAQIDGKWYYFDAGGYMVIGWKQIEKKWYYFDSNGIMATGWKKIGGKWYYFSGGAMVSGWKKISGKWYFFANGAMVTGEKVIGGKKYFFDSEGGLIETDSFPELTYDDQGNDKLLPSKGTPKIAVILVDFPDCKHSESLSKRIHDILIPGVHGYYQQESYKALDLDISFVGDWYTSQNKRDYYTALSEKKGVQYARAVLLDEAIRKLDDTVDFSEFDSNQDGFIDEIVFICAGDRGEFGDFWWPCANNCNYIIEADGVRPGAFAWISGQYYDDNVTIHEVGHALGLRDLYDVNNNGAESFTLSDMMKNNNGGFNAFSKIQLKWIDPICVSDNTELTLKPSDKSPCAAIVYPKGNEKSQQFFVLEYIKYVHHGSVDRVPNGGLRIWRVNKNAYGSGLGNTPYIENVDWQDNVWGTIIYDQGQDYHDVIWTEGMDFTPYKYPSSYFYKGSLTNEGFEFSGISITDIKTDGKKLTCKVSYEDEPSENSFTYSFDYKAGNKLYGTIVFPVEVYLNGTDISLKTKEKTKVPVSYYIDYLPERHAYTQLKFEADISDYRSDSYRLTIKAGTLINAFGIPNDEIKIDMTDIVGGDSQVAFRNDFTYGISGIVKMSDELYTFQIIDGKVNLLHIDKNNNILGSKPLFKETYEYSDLRAAAYDTKRMILQVHTNDVLYVYSVKTDGSYELITSIKSYYVPQNNFVNKKLFALRANKTGRCDACLIDIDKKTVTPFIPNFDMGSYNIEMSTKHIYVWGYEGAERIFILYDGDGTKLVQKKLTDICVLEDTEFISSLFEFEGNAAFVSRTQDVDGMSRIYVNVVNENLDVLKRKCIYKDAEETIAGKMYQTDDGFVLDLETTKTLTSHDNTAYYTSYATAVFYDKNLNLLFERNLDEADKGNYIDGVIKIDDNEYIIYSPFASMCFSINKTDIKVCNHDYSKTTMTRKATYKEDGIKTYTCTRCGDSYIEVIPNLSKYSEEWISGKWYNKDGTQTYKYKLSWKKDKNGWWVQDTGGWYPKNSWQKIDGKWYYFKANGYMASGEWCKGYWINKNGTWTYNAKGSWKKDSKGWGYGDARGWSAKSQWEKIDGKWYYFDSEGYVVTGTKIIGGKTYKFDVNGACINP